MSATLSYSTLSSKLGTSALSTCTSLRYWPFWSLSVRLQVSHWIRLGTGYPVSRIVNHPQFNGTTLANDVSLLQAASPIQLNNRARIIPLRRQFVGAGVATVISGWGLSWNTSETGDGNWRIRLNHELEALYHEPNIVTVAKSRRMRWAGHVL